MSKPAPISQANTASVRNIHLICAARAHEDVKSVIEMIKNLALDQGYGGPFHLHYKCPKPRTVGANALILTDHPSRMVPSASNLLGIIVSFLKCGSEIQILGHYHVRPDTEAASALLRLDDMRKAMRSARIKEGLFMAKQRGVPVGRKRVDADLTAVQGDCGSYRRTAKSLKDQGIEISKSTLHAIARGRR